GSDDRARADARRLVGGGSRVCRRRLQKTARLFINLKQSLDLLAQAAILAASLIEECLPLVGISDLQGRNEDVALVHSHLPFQIRSRYYVRFLRQYRANIFQDSD